MNPSDDERLLGEYRLKELLAENRLTRTWLAEQVSIARKVLVDELLPGHEDLRERFLADVRAKAAVEHPLIGSVYEAMAQPGCCFFAHELLPGATLAERIKAREPFKPAQLVHILRRIVEGELHHEALGQPTEPLEPRHVHVDSHGVIRMDNRALAGERSEDESERDTVALGAALVPLVADSESGTTRMLTLLGWMRGEGLEKPLSWKQVHDFTLQIEHQLADPPVVVPPPGAARHRKAWWPRVLGAGIALLVGLVAVVLRLKPETPSQPVEPPPPEAVRIEKGDVQMPEGEVKTVPAFRISTHEVTIGQYAAFLETLARLADTQRQRSFDHQDQPAGKTSHEPDDWAALFAAAKTGGVWKETSVTLDHPVVGIDWWDAAAYAEWKKARLPGQAEWFAALADETGKPASFPSEAWISVTAKTTDRTQHGVTGMAGSVCEWTCDIAPNPLNPLGQPQWVLVGGSYLKPGSNALTREWTDDRSLRRADLGFRLVMDAAADESQ